MAATVVVFAPNNPTVVDSCCERRFNIQAVQVLKRPTENPRGCCSGKEASIFYIDWKLALQAIPRADFSKSIRRKFGIIIYIGCLEPADLRPTPSQRNLRYLSATADVKTQNQT